MNIKGLSLAATFALLAVAWPEAATAIPLTLTAVPGNTVGPQSSQNPCVIAATTCQQPAGFGYNNYTQGGNISSYNMYSTTPTAQVNDGVQGTPYTVAQLLGAGLSSFVVGVDVNTTGAAGETLQLFQVIINGVVAYDYIGPTLIGNISNNGNGYADWTLGTVSLAGLSPNSTVLFHAVWNNGTDGGEHFFLVPTSVPTVPEPTSLLLLGAGMSAFGILRYRQSKKS